MSIADIIPAVLALSRGEKFQLAQLLLKDLAREEPPMVFKEGQVYPIYTPEYAPQAVAQLAKPQGGGDSLMSLVEQCPYCDRNPASAGLDLMPDIPIALRHQSRSLSAVGLVDSGASISVR